MKAISCHLIVTPRAHNHLDKSIGKLGASIDIDSCESKGLDPSPSHILNPGIPDIKRTIASMEYVSPYSAGRGGTGGDRLGDHRDMGASHMVEGESSIQSHDREFPVASRLTMVAVSSCESVAELHTLGMSMKS